MEFLGMLFLVLFFCIFGVYALIALLGAVIVVGLIYQVPKEKRAMARRIFGRALICVSILLLISAI